MSITYSSCVVLANPPRPRVCIPPAAAAAAAAAAARAAAAAALSAAAFHLAGGGGPPRRALRRGARCAWRLRRHARRRPRDDRRRAERLGPNAKIVARAARGDERSRRGGRDPRVGDWTARRTLNLKITSLRSGESHLGDRRAGRGIAPRGRENKRVVWCGKSGRACGDGKEYGSGRGVRHVDREKEAR